MNKATTMPSPIRAKVRTFAQLIRDMNQVNAWVAATLAVESGLVLAWSNGRVEGEVNRLKLLKRQMYGRGSFNLLKARVLHRAA